MSLQKKSSPTRTSPPPPLDLKQRVITCLNKLADRDTLAVATTELESIAKTLTQDSFSSFLNCIHNTDSSAKSPVRKQCVSILTLLSHSHGDSLSPHLSKMISTVTRRLRDPDSAVRSACVTAVTAMSSNITGPSFSVVYKPLTELLFTEQDHNAQIGAAMCLAAGIEAAADAEEAERLGKLLPKMGKLVRSEGFKAKAAVLGVIGSVVSVGGAGNKGVLDWLVPCFVEFLSSEDWMARKAAAEGLGRVAVVEKELAMEYKKLCLNALESRRFDKVKVVRETMNRTLVSWKEVPSDFEEVSISVSSPSPSPSNSSSIDNGSIGCCPPVMKSSHNVGFKTPRTKKTVPTSRSPQSDCSIVTISKKESSLKTNDRSPRSTPMFSRQEHEKPSDWKIEIAVPQSPSSKVDCEDHLKKSDSRVLGSVENGKYGNSGPQTKRVLFSKIRDEKVHIFGGSRSGSRVVPFTDDEHLGVVVGNATEEVYDNPKDAEDLCLIHEQLLQIENQQSSLLELLQRFIGSSQSGINSLETRVHGIEMALDEISYDLGLSSQRIPNSDSAENTCFKLPGAEFLSSKFWRRTEGRFSNSGFSSSGSIQPMNAVRNTLDKDARAEMYKSDSQNFQHQNRSEFFLNPLADGCSDLRGNSGFYINRTSKNIIQDTERVRFCDARRIDNATSATCTAPV